MQKCPTKSLSCAVSAAVFSVLLSTDCLRGQQLSGDVVAGAIARGEAFFSGRIHYSVASGAVPNSTPDEYEFVFSSTSWKRRQVCDASTMPRSFSKSAIKAGIDPKTTPTLQGLQEKTIVSHRGRRFEYQSTPQQDGVLRRTGRVESGDIPMAGEYPPFPQFLGTFYLSDTLKYVVENRDKGVRKGTEKVGDYETVVYEWPVPKQNVGAFHSFSEVVRDGGSVRAYISPSLGYAIPKVEHVGATGKVGAAFEASEFVVKNGIHIPKIATMRYFNNKGLLFIIEYKLGKIERVNDVFSDDEFALQLPIGTEMADARDGKNSLIFEVTEDGSAIPDNLGDVLRRERNLWGWMRSWQGAVTIGAVLGLAALLGLFLLRRIRSGRKK